MKADFYPFLKQIIIVVLTCFATNIAVSQSNKDPNKILKEAEAQTTDTLKAKLLVEAALVFYSNNQRSEMMATVTKARQLLIKNKHLPAMVNMYDLLSKYYGTSGQPSLRHLYTDSIILVSRNAGYEAGIARGLLAKAIAYSYDENPEAALAPLEEALTIFQKNGDIKNEALTLKVIAGNLGNLGRGNECIHISKQAVEKYIKAGFAVDAGLVYANMVWMSIVDKKLDTALYYNTKASQIADTIKVQGKLHFLIALRNAEIFARLQRFEEAAAAINKATSIADKMGTNTTAGVINVTKGIIAREKGDFRNALAFDLTALNIHEKSGDKAQYVEQYKNLAIDYEGMNQFDKALLHYKKYYIYKDSIADKKSAAQLNVLNTKYETASKEKTIAEQKLALVKKNTRLRTLLISLGAALLALLLLAVIYLLRRKTYRQSVAALKKEQEIISLKALMAGEEKERNRLAKELHDGLGGILAAAQMQISHTPSAENDKAAILVQKAATETRRIAHNLLPETLLRYGLKKALEAYCLSITESKLLQLEFDAINVDESLSQNVALSVYRIIQELINNIIKHAGATEAFIQLHKHNNLLTITVEDNGKGFSVAANNTGIGLSNIQSRVSVLNGTMDIKSEQQKGTSVYIELTLSKNDNAGV